MPIYEYVCDQCGHHLEALQKISEEPLVYCPECGEAALRKKVSAAAFRLKGTGWYETDFKDGGKEKKESGRDKSDQKAVQKPGNETRASSGDTKSDNKSDTSSDSKTGSSKGETKPAADSGSSDSGGGSSKPSSGASQGSD
jgi:putative FmdB family regulatory protein